MVQWRKSTEKWKFGGDGYIPGGGEVADWRWIKWSKMETCKRIVYYQSCTHQWQHKSLKKIASYESQIPQLWQNRHAGGWHFVKESPIDPAPPAR